MNQRELFFRHLAQTSAAPLALEIVHAEGLYLRDAGGKRYLDLIGGISVCNTGHRHPAVVEAIRKQADQYLHLLVYGEMLQSPQISYASRLTSLLPPSLHVVYFTNSGTEATEGAMKLAKRATGRTRMVAFNRSYHGSTQGALSVMGDEYWRNAFRPLLPGVVHLDYNDFDMLDQIDDHTACVIAETVQAENGVIKPQTDPSPGAKRSSASANFLLALRQRCNDTGALLILDEIQTGFGRTGSLWGFEQYGAAPDILLLGKALGGGLPLGAFIAGKNLMDNLMDKPVLGHITTFGGHPLSCAAGLAALNVLLEEIDITSIRQKESRFRQHLVHPAIRSVRSAGLLIAVEFDSFETNKLIIDRCIALGLLTDWFLFASHCLRIAPPLTIRDEEIDQACAIILRALNDL
jgi:acetylornithine/N-succinyldiaminopimelate aminotransferase